jgi:hypothetical protein
MELDWIGSRVIVWTCLAACGCAPQSSTPPPATPPAARGGDPSPVHESVASERMLPLDTSAVDAKLPNVGGFVGENEPAPPPVEEADMAPLEGLLGRWTINIATGPTISRPWLIEFTGKVNEYQAEVTDSLVRLKPKLLQLEATDERVGFQLMLDRQSLVFEGAVIDERIKGTIEASGQVTLAWLERTKQKTLRNEQAAIPALGAKEYEQAQELPDAKARAAQLIEFVDAHPDSTIVFDALRTVVRIATAAEIDEAQGRGIVQKYEELAKQWGDRWSASAMESIAYDLATGNVFPGIALEIAERANEALPEDAPVARKQFVQTALAVAMIRGDKAEAGKKLLDELIKSQKDDGELRYYSALASEKLGDIDAAMDLLMPIWPHPLAARELERLWKAKHNSLDGFEARLDEVYAERFPPLAVEPHAGRADPATNQTALVELFTGTSCPPCVAADVAFDALGRTFKRSDVVLLQYHLHVPGPDPLTNSDNEARSEYYRAPGTPMLLINGKEAAPGGGSRQAGKEKYDEFRAVIEKELDRKSSAKIELTATRDDDSVTIDVKVSDAPNPSEKLRLRIALVEDTVRFMGLNGVRMHHSVVRAMAGGSAGVPVTEAAITHQEVVDLAKLKEKLAGSLGELEKQFGFEFPAKPLDLDRLGVAAILQNDSTRAVVQSAFVEVDAKQADAK